MDILVCVHRDLEIEGPFIKVRIILNPNTEQRTTFVKVSSYEYSAIAKCICGNCSIPQLVEIAANKIVDVYRD